jgi:hypothetical protein
MRQASRSTGIQPTVGARPKRIGFRTAWRRNVERRPWPSSPNRASAVKGTRSGGCADSSRRLLIVKEMLGAMEAQTSAGHRYTMEKVVRLLREEIVCATLRTSLRNKGELSQLVDQLAREALRLLPNVELFSGRADIIVALLLGMLKPSQSRCRPRA